MSDLQTRLEDERVALEDYEMELSLAQEYYHTDNEYRYKAMVNHQRLVVRALEDEIGGDENGNLDSD